ncbi:helix-hairpin-helix domain-containing protein [Kitasatospora sp. NPDC058170]|uniref:helix-hairpin-helix domain-containing protein n=1 Tax=Kitasatospora sp. NPDC058170 TaxID=3346364 RepID=UPI0036DC4317
MTTMSMGAARRHEITETARRRMSTLLPESEGPPEVGEPSATGPPSDAGPVPAPVGGSPFRLSPALALERRAVAGLLVLLLLAVGYAVQHFWLARPRSVPVPAVAVAPPVPGEGAAAAPGSPTAAAEAAGPGVGSVTGSGAGADTVVVVDIAGRVPSPGVHTLPGGSRVADALRVAGGPLPETETKSLNLARVLTDGEQILVGAPGPPPAGAPLPSAAPMQPVSLNRATLQQLDTLPGVGPTLAQRILAFRTSHGSFRSLDQLRQVSGIGERTYAEIRPMLTL